MVAEGPDREDRHDDADIDARFEEIVAGLRAEQAASQQRRREAIRRAQSQRGQSPTPNRPLEGHDDPNPWPPRRRAPGVPDPGGPSATNPPVTGAPREGSTAEPPRDRPSHPRESPSPRDRPSHPRESPSHRAEGPRGRHRARPGDAESDYDDSPTASPDPSPDSPPDSWRGWDGPDEEEHFIPPTPPLPAGDLHLWAIVVGLLGGPLILILSNGFTLLRADWWTPLGILLSVAGVVLLVLRLPKNRDDTDFTGGAQV